ncbi:MAG: glycosyltransferase, partial [Bacteroidales bacterium]
NGIVVPKNDPQSLAEKISFLADNRSFLHSLGENARQTIASRFTKEKYLYNLDAIYKLTI